MKCEGIYKFRQHVRTESI